MPKNQNTPTILRLKQKATKYKALVAAGKITLVHSKIINGMLFAKLRDRRTGFDTGFLVIADNGVWRSDSADISAIKYRQKVEQTTMQNVAQELEEAIRKAS